MCVYIRHTFIGFLGQTDGQTCETTKPPKCGQNHEFHVRIEEEMGGREEVGVIKGRNNNSNNNASAAARGY